MRSDTPPPMEDFGSRDNDDEDIPVGEDDIEIIEDVDISDDENYELPEHGRNDSVLMFKEHTGAVFSCALDKTNTWAVSGGEDDRAFVWDLKTGHIRFDCTGHKDSVTCVGFNHDSSLVATGDMSGVIKVWNVERKDQIWEFETSDLRWLSWHISSNVLMAGSADGNTWLWKVPSGECKTFPSFGPANSCGCFHPDGKHGIIGYDDGSVRIWDLKTATVKHSVADSFAHRSSVTSIDCTAAGDMIVSGSTDASTKLINFNSGKVVATFFAGEGGSDEEVSSNSVESVTFSKTSSLVAVGTLSGMLSIWDIPTQQERHKCQHEAGIVKLLWNEHLVITACLDGIVRSWDSRSGEIVSVWEGHTAEILDISLSRDGKTILTASEDSTCAVFQDALHESS